MIEQNVIDKIKEYCKLNEITDVKSFLTNIIETGLNVEKYGTGPFGKQEPKIKEVEVIKEIEVIKEVTKEVPVEIIKEVVVEKEVYITDDNQVSKLANDIEILNKELTEYNQLKRNYSTLVNQHKDLNDLTEGKDQAIDRLNDIIVEKDEEIKQLKNSRDIYGE